VRATATRLTLHLCGVCAGKVYAFGDSTDGKLGLGDVTALKLPDVIYKPTLVSALRGEKIIKVPDERRTWPPRE
jgi:hypothetical protein